MISSLRHPNINWTGVVALAVIAFAISACDSLHPEPDQRTSRKAPQTGSNLARSAPAQRTERAAVKKRAEAASKAKLKAAKQKASAREGNEEMVVRGGFR